MTEIVFVIMLDDFLNAHPDDWPISKANRSLTEIRKETQHDGNPALRPRTAFNMRRLEDKSLRNTSTGVVSTGAIYEATATAQIVV